jgi:hypothetical protein
VHAVCTSEAWRPRAAAAKGSSGQGQQRRARFAPGGHGEAREQQGTLGCVEAEEGAQLGEGRLIEVDLAAAALGAAALGAAARRHGRGA